MLLPGRAQVHVRVDEARQQVAAGAVDALGAGRRRERAGRCERGDPPAAHEHVERGVDARPRVEHPSARDEQLGGRRRPADERLGHAGWGAGKVTTVALLGAPRPASSS